MDIIHRIGLGLGGEEELQAYQQAGINDIQYNIFVIAESDERWINVQDVLQKFGSLDLENTVFDEVDRSSAAYLTFRSEWYNGYPQPEDNYQELVYDRQTLCPCGIGKRQIAPYRLSSEPRWGRKAVMQIYWASDPIFMTPEAWRSVFQPFGIGCRPVVRHRTGLELESVVQLDVTRECDVETDGLVFEDCEVCGRRKYNYVMRGFEPRPLNPEGPIFMSKQWFGSGGQADRLTIVSQELYRAISSAGLKSVHFGPCR